MLIKKNDSFFPNSRRYFMIIADNDLYNPTLRVEKKPFRNAPVHKRDPIGGNVRTDFPMV